MQAEQLYESLLTATEADETRVGEDAAKKKDRWLVQFMIAFGTDEGDDATTFNGSIPQVLMMFNGDLIKEATSTGKGGFLDKVATSSMRTDPEDRHPLPGGPGPQPSAKELKTANRQLLAARRETWPEPSRMSGGPLLNSNEFIINH